MQQRFFQAVLANPYAGPVRIDKNLARTGGKGRHALVNAELTDAVPQHQRHLFQAARIAARLGLGGLNRAEFRVDDDVKGRAAAEMGLKQEYLQVELIIQPFVPHLADCPAAVAEADEIARVIHPDDVKHRIGHGTERRISRQGRWHCQSQHPGNQPA